MLQLEQPWPVAFPNIEISAFRHFAVSCGWMIHPTTKVSEEVNRKCHPKNTVVQLSTDPECHQCTASQTDEETDRQTT